MFCHVSSSAREECELVPVSLGAIGGTGFIPIVNAPEVAILGVGKTDIRCRKKRQVDVGNPDPNYTKELNLLTKLSKEDSKSGAITNSLDGTSGQSSHVPPSNMCQQSNGTSSQKPAPAKKQKVIRFTLEDMELAVYIWSKVEQLASGQRKPNLNTWADHIRLCREQDGRSHADARFRR